MKTEDTLSPTVPYFLILLNIQTALLPRDQVFTFISL